MIKDHEEPNKNQRFRSRHRQMNSIDASNSIANCSELLNDRHEFLDCLFSMEIIKGYEFPLFKPVYLHSPKNKFWQVTVIDDEVRYRAGVLREGDK
jgi:hypothetical protein